MLPFVPLDACDCQHNDCDEDGNRNTVSSDHSTDSEGKRRYITETEFDRKQALKKLNDPSKAAASAAGSWAGRVLGRTGLV